MLTADDWMSLAGSLLSSLRARRASSTSTCSDGSGTLGLPGRAGIVAFLRDLRRRGRRCRTLDTIVVDRLVTAALYAAAGRRGLRARSARWSTPSPRAGAPSSTPNFFTHDMAGVSPTAPLNQGGILHAIVGTLIEVGIAIAVSRALGHRHGGLHGRGRRTRFSRLVRTVVEAMTALPEILAGLFVYVTLIVGFGLPKSGLAASVAMAVTMVPIIARASEVALRVVPSGLREASIALGASHWQTVRKVVLPSARAGLATATILAVARGIGETAVVAHLAPGRRAS